MGTDEEINPETAEVLHEAMNDVITAMYLSELEQGQLHEETDIAADLRSDIEDLIGH